MSTLLYSISIIVVFILCCITKKTEKRIDIIPIMILTFLCILSYQTFICWMFSIFHIAIQLIPLTITNIGVIIGLGIAIKKKGVQTFVLTKTDTILTGTVILLAAFILHKDIGNLENIRYFSTDASIHYIAAREFYENEQMLNKTENTETATQMMPIAYVNVGILFKAFAPIVGEMNLYKIFLLLDSTIFCFTGILFYYILKRTIQNKWHLLLAASLTIIYLIGYPLNNLLSGFYYLGIGCLFINAILYYMTLQDKKIGMTRMILFLLNTGLILSYALFAPVVYLSIFLYDAYKNKRKYHKLWNREWLFDTIITLILPGLIGVIFLLLPNIETVKYIAQEGYIYKNLWNNIVFFLPFAIYFLVKQIKEKTIDYAVLYFSMLICYMLLLYIGTKVNMVSNYYFYKNAYILWAILLLYFFYGMQTLLKKYPKQKIAVIVYFVLYVCLLTFTSLRHTHILSMFDLYENNHFLITQKENLTSDDIAMLTYLYEHQIIDKTQQNILFLGDFMQEAWIRSLFQYRNRYPLEARNHLHYIEKWNRGETEYLVCFEKSENYNILKQYCKLEESKLIFSTKNAKLYQK